MIQSFSWPQALQQKSAGGSAPHNKKAVSVRGDGSAYLEPLAVASWLKIASPASSDSFLLRFGERHGAKSTHSMATLLEKLPAIQIQQDAHRQEFQRLRGLLQDQTRVEASDSLNGHTYLAKNEAFIKQLMTRALGNSFRGVEQILPYQLSHPIYNQWSELERRKNYWGAVAVLAGEKDGKPFEKVLESNNWYVPTGYGHVVDTVCSEKQILIQANQLIHDQGIQNPHFKVFGFINNAFDEFPAKKVKMNDITPCGKCMNDFQSIMHRSGDDEFNQHHLSLSPEMPFVYLRRNNPNDKQPFSLRVVPIKEFGKRLGERTDSRFSKTNLNVLNGDDIPIHSCTYPTVKQRHTMIEKNLAAILPKEVDAAEMTHRLEALLPKSFLKAKAMYDMERLEHPKRDPVVAFLIYASKVGGQWTLEASHHVMYSPKTRHYYYPELKAASNKVDDIILVGYYGQSVPLNPEALEILQNKHRTVPNPLLATLENDTIQLSTMKDELPMLYVSAG